MPDIARRHGRTTDVGPRHFARGLRWHGVHNFLMAAERNIEGIMHPRLTPWSEKGTHSADFFTNAADVSAAAVR